MSPHGRCLLLPAADSRQPRRAGCPATGHTRKLAGVATGVVSDARPVVRAGIRNGAQTVARTGIRKGTYSVANTGIRKGAHTVGCTGIWEGSHGVANTGIRRGARTAGCTGIRTAARTSLNSDGHAARHGSGLKFVFAAALWLMLQSAGAVEPVLEFENPAQRQLYEELVHEYRCLKCQNQNLAESRAGLAYDLKKQVYQQVLDGRNQQQIDDYLVSRYGEFVLYRPRFQASTWLLWLGPFALLAVALWYGYRISSRRTTETAVRTSPDALAEARNLLYKSENK